MPSCPECGDDADLFIYGNPVYATAFPCGCEFVPENPHAKKIRGVPPLLQRVAKALSTLVP